MPKSKYPIALSYYLLGLIFAFQGYSQEKMDTLRTETMIHLSASYKETYPNKEFCVLENVDKLPVLIDSISLTNEIIQQIKLPQDGYRFTNLYFGFVLTEKGEIFTEHILLNGAEESDLENFLSILPSLKQKKFIPGKVKDKYVSVPMGFTIPYDDRIKNWTCHLDTILVRKNPTPENCLLWKEAVTP